MLAMLRHGGRETASLQRQPVPLCASATAEHESPGLHACGAPARSRSAHATSIYTHTHTHTRVHFPTRLLDTRRHVWRNNCGARVRTRTNNETFILRLIAKVTRFSAVTCARVSSVADDYNNFTIQPSGIIKMSIGRANKVCTRRRRRRGVSRCVTIIPVHARARTQARQL